MKENPYELLYMYRMGDRYAEKRLYTIYKPYAEMVVRTFLKKNEYLRGYEEDLSQAYDLRTRVGHDPISLSDDGVPLSTCS